jgi:hypothetical protein
MNSKVVAELLAKKNVVSVGRGIKRVNGKSTGRPCIVVGVRRKIPLSDLNVSDVVPQTVGNPGEETDVVEIGDIKLL